MELKISARDLEFKSLHEFFASSELELERESLVSGFEEEERADAV